MATLKEIRRRIAGVENTGKITRAMKMISAIKLKRAQQKMIAARNYDSEVNRILAGILSRSLDITHPLLNGRENVKGPVDLIIITSDKGMCGAFNENLLKKTEEFIKNRKEQGIEVELYALGRKGRDYFKRKGYKISKELINVTDQEIKKYLEKAEIFFGGRHTAKESCETVIVYNRFKSAGSQEVTFKKLLPAVPGDIVYKHGIDYIYEPNKDEIIDYMAKEAVMSRLYLSYIDSVAAETSARMIAMEKATKNADDLISSLTLKMNKARQSAITGELIDIVGGAEALS